MTQVCTVRDSTKNLTGLWRVEGVLVGPRLASFSKRLILTYCGTQATSSRKLSRLKPGSFRRKRFFSNRSTIFANLRARYVVVYRDMDNDHDPKTLLSFKNTDATRKYH